ncbi:hypothetical protein [Dyella silvatica]|uniref:hypothetical protein n=1 Tax=Dyella silvatica TaxID=2992128 RepID=UPI00225436A0|nr:hypothetical protein [Dyella silvatica]
MKTLGLATAMMLLSMGAAYAQQTTPARKPLLPGELDAVFLNGRAQYFHDIVQVRHCEKINEQAVHAINQRFENAHAQLAARFGAIAKPASHPMPPPIAEQQCEAMTIDAYSNHVRELEQYLSRLGSHS